MSELSCSQTRKRSIRSLLRRGGDERVRTDDPLLAKQVLSQLSYTPIAFEDYTPKIKQRFVLKT